MNSSNLWRRVAVVFAGLLLLGSPPLFAQSEDTLFSQANDTAASSEAWYSDNWYQPGTGFSGTLRSITLRGYTNGSAPYASHVFLDEFSDQFYETLSRVITISDNAPFLPTPSEVTISGLSITIEPNKFYRLRTTNDRQNYCVILQGDPTMGYAMRNWFVYGVGRVEYYYTFYPYIVSNTFLLVTCPPSLVQPI